MQKGSKLFKNFKFNYNFFPNFKEERTQKFTTILFTIIALGIFGLFAINPTISTIAKLRKELDDNNLVDSKLQQKISNLTTLQNKYNGMQKDLPPIFSAIPKNPELPLLAAEIQAAAKNANVDLENFQSFQVEVQKQASQRKYSGFSFTVSAAGEYSDIYSFLKTLSNMQRVVSLDLLSLTKKSAGNQVDLSIKGEAFFNP